MVWWIMYLYEKVSPVYACVAGWKSITVSEWMCSSAIITNTFNTNFSFKVHLLPHSTQPR